MQRKNYFLKTSLRGKRMKNAMAMMMAIIVLVVIATVMSLSLALTVQTSKRTTDMYLYEQSVLISQSAAEYAMLRISQEAGPCSLPRLDFGYGGNGTPALDIYDINITMRYIYTDPSLCKTNSDADGSGYATVIYPDSNGNVVLDITVTANPAGTTEPIRYFRRSIQKM